MMLACLLVLVLGDEPRTKDIALQPRWVVGQETLYQGVVKEVSRSQAIQLQRQYHLEVRLLVLAVEADRVELACCTKLTQTEVPSGAQPQVSAHLTHCTLNRTGQVLNTTARNGWPLVLDGPATWENGFLLTVPAGALTVGQRWEVAEAGRLPRRCTLGLSEPGQTEDAWLVRCEQESVDWQRPRADSTAWRRTDRLSYSARYGLPRRIERVIQRRAPAYQQVTTELVTEYELVRQDQIEGPMLAERQRDVHALKLYQEEFAGLSAKADQPDAREALRRLATRLWRYQDSPGRTPFRESAVTLQSQVEAAASGQVVRVDYRDRTTPVKEGEFAPDFRLLANDGATITLKQFRGRPCLLVFVTPGTNLTKAVTEELALLQATFQAKTFACLVLSNSDQTALLTQVKHPLWKNLDGRTELLTYGVKETPTLVFLDVDGSISKMLTGWGPEPRQTIEKLARKELAKMK